MRGRRVGIKPNTSEWLAWRALGITATDTAAILSLSPWHSPFSLWWRKTADRATLADGGVLEEPERSQRYELGHLVEPVLHRFFDAEVLEDGWRIGSGGCWQGRGALDWMRATPDRMVYADRTTRTPVAVVEFKTDASGDFGDDLGDGVPEIPAYYRAQMIHQFAVVGVDRGWLTVLTSRMAVRHYGVVAQPGEIDTVIGAAHDFQRSLQHGTPPPLDGHDETTRTLKRLHPDLEDGSEVDIDPALAGEYRQALAQAEAADQRKAEVTNLLLSAIGNGRYARCGEDKLATRSVSAPRKFSSGAFKADHPDLYEQYRVERAPEVRLTPAKTKKQPQPITEEIQK